MSNIKLQWIKTLAQHTDEVNSPKEIKDLKLKLKKHRNQTKYFGRKRMAHITFDAATGEAVKD
jgi:hypothetical protein